MAVLSLVGCARIAGGGFVQSQCGDLGSSADAQKVEAFLRAGDRFEADTLDLSADVEATCAAMANDLGVTIPSAREGQLQVEATCAALATEMRSIIDEALPEGTSIRMTYEAPVCSFELDAMASCVAECDANVSADVDVQCTEGRLVGVCSGTCTGECYANGTVTETSGYCDGECAGSCDVELEAPRCEGDAVVEADAQCQAACEATLDARAECTEPSLAIEVDTAVDPAAQARLDALVATIQANYPRLLADEARLENVVRSGSDLVSSFDGAADAAGNLGYMSMACMADSTMVAASALADVRVTLEVSVEVSASATAQAGATAG